MSRDPKKQFKQNALGLSPTRSLLGRPSHMMAPSDIRKIEQPFGGMLPDAQTLDISHKNPMSNLDDRAIVQMTGFNNNIYGNVEPDNLIMNVSPAKKRNLSKVDKMRLTGTKHIGRDFTKKIYADGNKPEDALYQLSVTRRSQIAHDYQLQPSFDDGVTIIESPKQAVKSKSRKCRPTKTTTLRAKIPKESLIDDIDSMMQSKISIMDSGAQTKRNFETDKLMDGGKSIAGTTDYKTLSSSVAVPSINKMIEHNRRPNLIKMARNQEPIVSPSRLEMQNILEGLDQQRLQGRTMVPAHDHDTFKAPQITKHTISSNINAAFRGIESSQEVDMSFIGPDDIELMRQDNLRKSGPVNTLKQSTRDKIFAQGAAQAKKEKSGKSGGLANLMLKKISNQGRESNISDQSSPDALAKLKKFSLNMKAKAGRGDSDSPSPHLGKKKMGLAGLAKAFTNSGKIDLMKKSNVSIAAASITSKMTEQGNGYKTMGTSRKMANVSSSLIGANRISINTEDFKLGKRGLMTNRANKNPKLDPIDPRLTASLINGPLEKRNNTRYDVNASPDSPSRNKIDSIMYKKSGVEMSQISSKRSLLAPIEDMRKNQTMFLQALKNSKNDTIGMISPAAVKTAEDNLKSQTAENYKLAGDIGREAYQNLLEISQTDMIAQNEIKNIYKTSCRLFKKMEVPGGKVITTHPYDFKNADIQKKYEVKSFVLDVGNLFKPLTYTFSGARGDFTVYFSNKRSQTSPCEENGFEFRADNQTQVQFPQKMQDSLPGTVRYPKEKLLYISFETSEPCSILIEMTQNYKDGKIPKQAPKAVSKPTFLAGEDAKMEALHSTAGAQMNINQLLKFRENQNDTPPLVNPLESTRLINQKIQSMIQSDDEIKRFFGTVERIGRKKNVVENVQNNTGVNYIKDNKRQASRSARKQSLNATQTQEIAKQLNKNDLKAEKVKEARLRKENTDRNTAALNLARHDIRKANREKVFQIMLNQTERRNKCFFWIGAAIIIRALTRQFAEFKRRKAEAKYMAAIFWKALLYKMQISISLKRKGKGFFDRERKVIRNAITQTWSYVEVKLDTAKELVVHFLKSDKQITEMRRQLCQSVGNMLALQQRSKLYFVIKRAQQHMVAELIIREKNRMMNVLARDQDPLSRVFSQALMRLDDDYVQDTANSYYLCCCNNYTDEFFHWRDEIAKLQSEKMLDLNDGYSYPFLQSRNVDSFNTVGYEAEWSKSFKGADAFCAKLTKQMSKLYTYEMVTAAERTRRLRLAEEKERNAGIPEKELARARKRRRQDDPLMNMMEKKIDAEEEKYAPDYYHKSLKDCAYYPRRPALKFIPMPDMVHVLLVQAVCLQFPRYKPNNVYKARIDWTKMGHGPSGIGGNTGFDSIESETGKKSKGSKKGSVLGSPKGKSRAGSQLSNI